MKISARFSFVESVIPPGCRKPREQVNHAGRITGTIREVTSAEAPVAITAKVRTPRTEEAMEIAYRWFGGKLWTSVHLHGGQLSECPWVKGSYGFEALPAELDLSDNCRGNRDRYLEAYWDTGSKAEVIKAIRASLRDILIVDGVVYRQAGEPRYVVMTFGGSGNHGGTSLLTDSYFNSNLKRESYFSLLELDAALAYATEVATNRRDTKSLPMAVNGGEYTVHIPDAIRLRNRRAAAGR